MKDDKESDRMEETLAERVTAVRISKSRVRSKSSSEHTEVL